MKLILIAVVVAQGWACRYDPLVMAQVAARNGYHTGGYLGAVALRDCSLRGQAVYIQWPDGTVDGPYLVADCLDPKDVPWGGGKWAVDLDWPTWKRKIALRKMSGDGPLPGVTIIQYVPVQRGVYRAFMEVSNEVLSD